MPVPNDDWLHSLDEIETTLATTLSALDDYERTWEQSFTESSVPNATPAPLHLMRLEERLGEWDMRLSAAADLTASVERELTDRQAAIGRWQELFNDWRGLIEQPAKPAAVTS
jgi:hypothetical protein